ncbi:MAG: SIS domain-containing protein [Candidatus Fusobacterium pullicola]|uniref:SIS domain-containing protein n=1 Tax=Candidatus Fusobacterium pullicola TaxID=2838601 RepID=A0A9E2KY25_9FUSO|nr:SIS domain-containing protein [uncultured Fusobacterium sp.]MBU3842123.1 SIS domain-containing protein [Candidatus Fusobacterium pullicola]
MLDINYIVKKHKLNDLEKNILLYIQNKINKNQKLSIRETAKDNYTSTTVIYSCIKKIGFKSFPDLIFYIKNSNKKPNIQTEINLSIPLELIKKYNDPLIMFCSIGIANNITSYMNERMALLGKRSIANGHIQLLENITNNTILFVVSESGETESLLDMIQIAKKNHVPIISFIGKKDSSVEKKSDYSFVLNHGIFFANVISTFEHLISKI